MMERWLETRQSASLVRRNRRAASLPTGIALSAQNRQHTDGDSIFRPRVPNNCGAVDDGQLDWGRTVFPPAHATGGRTRVARGYTPAFAGIAGPLRTFRIAAASRCLHHPVSQRRPQPSGYVESPKPHAPDGIHGEFQPIATSLTGSRWASICRAYYPATHIRPRSSDRCTTA